MEYKFGMVYKRKATRRLLQFVNPRISRAEDWQFPINSMVYWAKISQIPQFLTRETPCFSYN